MAQEILHNILILGSIMQSLCGHISPVESVAFDASEILVLGGASSGVIKLWDVEEAKSTCTRDLLFILVTGCPLELYLITEVEEWS